MRKFKIRNKSGQGLIETIVAIGIIVSGIVGMMNLTIQNQSSSEDSKERLIAVNLAREGIELARNARDTNWLSCEIVGGSLNCNDWDQVLSSGSDSTAALLFDVENNTWSIDFTADSIMHDYARVWRRASGDASFIGAQFQSSEEQPAGAVLTGYRRLLELSPICEDKTVSDNCVLSNPKIGIRVVSRVQWESRGKSNEIVAEERLFNWR